MGGMCNFDEWEKLKYLIGAQWGDPYLGGMNPREGIAYTLASIMKRTGMPLADAERVLDELQAPLDRKWEPLALLKHWGYQ